MASNLTRPRVIFENDEHIFDNPLIRSGLILIYTIVFILCFFGNLAVVLVVTIHSRMRNITKFFLGNLAFANVCVGIFCIYQSLTTYLYESWFYGDFMCKLHHFTQSLCHAASVLILVAIAIERYLVLLHPFKARQLITLGRLAVVITAVWVSSAAIASPRLYYFGTIKIRISGRKDTICVPKRTLYDPAMADTIYFILLYVIPLTIISILYTRIATHLHRSVASTKRLTSVITANRKARGTCRRKSSGTSSNSCKASGRKSLSFKERVRKISCNNISSEQRTVLTDTTDAGISRNSFRLEPSHVKINRARSHSLGNPDCSFVPEAMRSQSEPFHLNQLDAGNREEIWLSRESGRATVFPEGTFMQNSTGAQILQRLYAVRILIAIVMTFALLNLPFHIRKLCLNYLASYEPDSDFSHLLTPITFLLMYTNCAVNPILYAFLNKNFRRSLSELVCLRSRQRQRFGGMI